MKKNMIKVVIGAILVALLAIPVMYVEGTEQEIYAVVAAPTSKIAPGEYQVGLDHTDYKTVKIEDSWYPLFRSSGDSMSLVMGTCYRFDMYGWRFGLFSLIPNVYAWDKVADSKCS